MRGLWQQYGPHTQFALQMAHMFAKLVLAAVLGGIIGLERELHHKPAGLRTNMFICFGSAMFTILSDRLAAQFLGDHTRIAAQIIPGIGFIGAGSILHSRGSVSGLTTAATIFVVASIGMACGGGLYLPAAFATAVILLALSVLGVMEGRFNLKPTTMAYALQGHSAEDMLVGLNSVLDEQQKSMQSVQIARTDDRCRVVFTVEGNQSEQEELLGALRRIAAAESVEMLGSAERE